jgi:hypothetical protein
VKRTAVLLVLSALVGALFGGFMQSLPAPSDAETFWVGNLAAPWGFFAFGAGWAQRSWRWAAVGGVAAELAIVGGFYSYLLVGPFVDPHMIFYPAPDPGLPFIGMAISGWLWAISFWVVPAIAGGIVYGLAGRWWGESRSVLAGAALTLPFFAEPAFWRAYDGRLKDPLIVWIVEAGVGIALLGLVLVLAKRRTSATGALTQPPEPMDSYSAGIRDY